MRPNWSASASLFLAASSALWAQTGTGNIQGTVKDPSGGVVPQAKVKAVHTATAREYASVTNEIGFYLFPAMQSGAYQLQVELPGMEVWQGNIQLSAGQQAVVDATLKPGALSLIHI